MEIQGLNDIVVWTYDTNNKINTDPDNGGFSYEENQGKVFDPVTGEEIKGLFKIDLESSLGATQANITGLAPTVARGYGSNAPAETNVGSPQPSIALGANDIPHAVYDLLTGLVKDKFGGYASTAQSKPAKGGILIHSKHPRKPIDVYFAFPYGDFQPGEKNVGTDTENPTITHDTLTFNASARPSDLIIYETFYSNEKAFDFANMLKYVSGQITNDATAGNKTPTDTQGNPINPGSGNSSEPSTSGSESNSNPATD